MNASNQSTNLVYYDSLDDPYLIGSMELLVDAQVFNGDCVIETKCVKISCKLIDEKVGISYVLSPLTRVAVDWTSGPEQRTRPGFGIQAGRMLRTGAARWIQARRAKVVGSWCLE